VEYLVHRRVARRIFHAFQRTSRLQKCFDHSSELALRMTLLHKTVVKRPPKKRRIVAGIANINWMAARDQQFHQVTRTRPRSIVQRRVTMAALRMRDRKSQIEH
jgi:hypothetical protein